jgi:hypothetical protein
LNGSGSGIQWGIVVPGILALIVGAVWVFQGAGLLKGSFMTGSSMWLWIGLVAVAGGVVLIYRGLAARSKA